MTAFRESIDESDTWVPAPTLALAPTGAHRPEFRAITANVQSFPVRAITPAQALEDLQRNAADGDLVFLQEICARYRPLVERAFPAPEWEVYFGERDNGEPIAFRTALFSKVEGRVTLLHAAKAGLHRRRYTTYLRLAFTPLGSEVHATNLHLVAGAFSDTAVTAKAERVREWNAGIAKHLAFVEGLVGTGLPVVGGGDYNRQLKRHKSLGETIAGKPVRYVVDPTSIDLLWCVDGDHVSWGLRSTEVYAGRERKNARRNSDHAARRATLTLAAGDEPVPPPEPEPDKEPGKPIITPAHDPFELTTFGDGTPKRVDWKTRAALEEVQRRLGYPLTIVQGSYNGGGVSASAGTHDLGGVVDLLAWDWQRKVRVLRATGFAAWYRPAIRGLWGAHIHAVLIDHGRLAGSASRQVDAYRAGRDGLKGNHRDTFWRPSPIPVFTYPPRREIEPDPGPTRTPDPVGPAAFPPNRTLDGVDTSHWQGGRIDVRKAQAAGLRWWYLKTTEGTTAVDATYAKRMRQARRAGVPVGSYHFARPDLGDAPQEARFFLEHADIRAGDMLPMLDLEAAEGLSSAQLTEWTGQWVTTLGKELARRGLVVKPIIYTQFDLGDGFGCLLWVARYSNDFRPPVIPAPWQKAVIWQHSNGRYGPVKDVPGFGPVDVNALNPDVPLSALRIRPVDKPAPTPTPTPPPTPKPTPTPTPTPDLATVRSELRAAAASLQLALDSLPER